ncbi:MAG TPA: RNA polymerase sigma factor [Bacteriovoracaceae bacterium]|nr:RNA polymerase sigma factor [Bacteriovoracaceae bacterium]
MSTIDDITIMNGIKAGNSKDVEMLFDKYSQSLLRHIHRITFNKEISEDILNETFMTIIQKINFYKDLTEEGQTFKAWIFRIATNEAIDVIRKEKREKIKRESLIATTSTPEHCSTEEQLQSVQNQGVIHSLMMELPTIQRIVINLKIKEDMSYLEISRVCGYSIESVKQALFKARLNLQKKLDLSEGAI